jgi:hypothetical protein
MLQFITLKISNMGNNCGCGGSCNNQQMTSLGQNSLYGSDYDRAPNLNERNLGKGESYVVDGNSIQMISREQLIKLPLRDQSKVFNLLTNINKKRIFAEKVNFIIIVERLSQSEIAHLNAALNFVKPAYYDIQYENLVSSFYAKWKAQAKNNFGWDDKKILFFVETWQTEYELRAKQAQEFYYSNTNNVQPGYLPVGDATSDKPDCSCLYDIYCGLFTGSCDTPTGGCNQVSGCGLFGTSNCKGTCSNLAVQPVAPLVVSSGPKLTFVDDLLAF